MKRAAALLAFGVLVGAFVAACGGNGGERAEIAFVRFYGTATADIYGTTTNGERRLTQNTAEDDWPDWSPGGRK